MYVILIIILTTNSTILKSWRIFVPFFIIQYLLTDDWVDFKISGSYSSFFCDWAPLPVYPQPPSTHCFLVAAPIIFSDHILDLLLFISSIQWFVSSLETCKIWHCLLSRRMPSLFTYLSSPEVEFRGSKWVFEGQYWHWPWGQITDTDLRLLLEMIGIFTNCALYTSIYL